MSGECYVIVYQYDTVRGHHEGSIFFWQGSDVKSPRAFLEFKLTMQSRLVDLVGEDSACSVTKVIQGKEPSHFLSIFDRKLVIKSGRVKDERPVREREIEYDNVGRCSDVHCTWLQ